MVQRRCGLWVVESIDLPICYSFHLGEKLQLLPTGVALTRCDPARSWCVARALLPEPGRSGTMTKSSSCLGETCPDRKPLS